jgi:hypothetical protein
MISDSGWCCLGKGDAAAAVRTLVGAVAALQLAPGNGDFQGDVLDVLTLGDGDDQELLDPVSRRATKTRSTRSRVRAREEK